MTITRGALLAGVAAMAIPGAVQAQTDGAAPEVQPSVPGAPAEETTGFRPIIVTAQRREESLQDIPLAISAFDSERIAESGFNDVEDLSSTVPNLNISALWGTSNPKIFMRGIGNNNFNQTAESKVAVYLDQVYLSAPSGQLFQMYDLDRIEVLRGPQGTFYGKNATGGAISVYSRLPDGDFEGYVRAGYGNYDAFDMEGAVSVPLGDTLSARFAGTYQRRDGYLTDLGTGRQVNDVDQWAARAIFRWQPTTDVDIRLNIHGGGSDSTHNNSAHRGIFDPVQLAGGAFVKLPSSAIIAGQGVDLFGYRDPNPDPYVNTYERDTFADIDLIGVSLVGDFTFGRGFTLTSVTGFERSERHVLQEGNGAPSTIFTIDWGPSEFETISQELRLSSPAEDRFSWLIGVFAYHERGEVNNFYNLADVSFALGGLEAFDQFYVQETDTYAAFAQAEFDITERLSLTIGGRINYEERNLDHRSFGTDANRMSLLPGPLFDIALEEGWTEWSGRAALSYEFTDDVMAFVSVNRGFTSGGFNTGAFNDPVGALEIYDPEIVVSYEAGLRTTLLDRRVQFNATAFLYDYSDLQVFTFTAGGLQFIENASDARISGLEFELQALVTDNFEVGGSLGLLDSEYRNFTRQVGGVVEDLSGNRLTGAPNTQFNVYGRYTLPTDIGDFTLRGDFTYTGNRFYDERQLRELSSEGATTNLDMRFSWTSIDERIELAVWAKNLTDEVNIIDVVEVGLFGYQNVWYNTPRTYGLTLGYRF
ncbi:MAG: TonB-dependent receptor [Parasphingopyxis sp.]|uniref:TonB-dependent receptor n=1 Tax=Parasphingopyxis sp. TaxID=1920299 RepID=UPI003F9F5D60